jgi:hypothetical protein
MNDYAILDETLLVRAKECQAGLSLFRVCVKPPYVGGEEALRILRIEDPGAFLKVCASVIPHELHLIPAEHAVVRWMNDDDEEDDAIPVIQKYE